MSKDSQVRRRVEERRKRLASAFARAAKIATARVARGNACLQLGRYVDEKDLQERRDRFRKAVGTML